MPGENESHPGNYSGSRAELNNNEIREWKFAIGIFPFYALYLTKLYWEFLTHPGDFHVEIKTLLMCILY